MNPWFLSLLHPYTTGGTPEPFSDVTGIATMDDTDEEAAMRDKIRAEEEAFAVEKIAVQRVHDLQEDLNVLTREVGRAAVQATKLDPQALECLPPLVVKVRL